MFDLEQHLRQWRQELEATLAFSEEEIDELEDHLRFSIDAKLKEGLTMEKACAESFGGLGSASALALEFAKDKLMPALGRLLVAWWRPAFLLILFCFIFSCSFLVQPNDPTNGPKHIPAYQMYTFWQMSWLGLLATLIFLPDKAQKDAVLVGIGNAFCLIPLLHIIVYNSLTEKIVGPGWSHMAASFGWWPIFLGSTGLIVVNLWWWKRDASRLAIAGMLVLVLALSPFVSEWIGNLSIRDVYSMPTASDVKLMGGIQGGFLNWKWVDVEGGSCIYITNILPFALALVTCAGIFLIQGLSPKRPMRNPERDAIFPSFSTLPWAMTLLGSGLCWIVSNSLEPNFSQQLREMNKSVFHVATIYGGMEIMVLISAALFFICGCELAKKLARASRIRPFYAWLIVIFELVLALGMLPVLGEDPKEPKSAEPLWLSWILTLSILPMTFYQGFHIVHKLRVHRGDISLWKFEGRNLVEMGLLLGLIFAGSWLILGMVAIVMAFESTSVISAMIAWGSWIKDPVNHHFYPQMYGTPDHLAFWVLCGVTYLSFCLAAGLGSVIALSGLEFIRFNSFRLYKVRKIRRELTQTLALNE